jgi:hypothetical protein
MAHLESASIEAFLRLGRELAAHGAPAHLIDAARAAADDERRHTKIVGRLAQRHGAVAPAAEVDAVAPRSLEAIARENAVEGCVMELYGAVEATWQARAAQDPLVRAAMQRICVDETRHAELALAVAKWADARLDARAWARIDRARRRAVAELSRRVDEEPAPALVAQAGIPSRRNARRLVARMSRQLWRVSA